MSISALSPEEKARTFTGSQHGVVGLGTAFDATEDAFFRLG